MFAKISKLRKHFIVLCLLINFCKIYINLTLFIFNISKRAKKKIQWSQLSLHANQTLLNNLKNNKTEENVVFLNYNSVVTPQKVFLWLPKRGAIKVFFLHRFWGARFPIYVPVEHYDHLSFFHFSLHCNLKFSKNSKYQ